MTWVRTCLEHPSSASMLLVFVVVFQQANDAQENRRDDAPEHPDSLLNLCSAIMKVQKAPK